MLVYCAEVERVLLVVFSVMYVELGRILAFRVHGVQRWVRRHPLLMGSSQPWLRILLQT